MRYLPLIAILLAFCCKAQSQVWKRFDANNGLPTNTITAIAQAPDEVMWFGSQSGLIRFDGTSFKQIPLPKGEVQPYIQSILLDKAGNVWAGSRSGLWNYDIHTRQFKNMARQIEISDMTWNADSTMILAGTAKGLKGIPVKQNTPLPKYDPKAHVYRVCFKQQYLYALCNYSLVRFHADGKADTLATLEQPLGFTRYEKEKCWIFSGRDRVLAISDNGTVKPLNLHFNPELLLQEQPAYEDKNGTLWFNTPDTFYCYKSFNDRSPLKYFWHKDNPYSVPHIANRMYMAHDGSMWIGTSGGGLGVCYPRSSKINFLPSAQVSSTHIWSMLHDKKEGKILYGTYSDVVVLDKKTGQLSHIPSPKTDLGFIVTGIIDFDNNYWYISTYTISGWRLSKKDYRYSRIPGLDKSLYLLGMSRISDHELLINSSIGVLHYNVITGLASRFPFNDPFPVATTFCSLKLHNGNYAAGDNYGFSITDRNKRLVNYDRIDGQKSLGTVFGLYESKNGNIYAANMSGALYKLDHRTKKLSHTALAGDPTIGYSFAGLNDSAFLLTTNVGVIYYNEYTGASKLLNRNNGLPFNDFDQFGIYNDSDYLMCSGPEGAIRINTSDLPGLLQDSVNLRVQHNNLVTELITIPAGTQSLTAHVYIGAKQLQHALQYEYTMNGLEQEWHRLEKGTEISYNYLPPGEYTLRVKASDPNHVVKTTSVSVAVIIVPLWYQTTWFKLLLVLIASVVLIVAVRYISWLKLKWKLRRLEAEQKVANERMRISRELHDNVGSQLTYLITGLEASEMMLKQQKTQSLNENLEQLQQSARDSMQQLRDSIWALNKEEMTIGILAARFKDWVHKMLALQQISLRFETDIEQDTTLDAIKALNLFRLLQETIHNIIKHAEATEIFVTILSHNYKMSCQVYDNGKGFIVSETDGNGLKNIQARAAECGGSVAIESTPGKGTTITVQIPLNTLNG